MKKVILGAMALAFAAGPALADRGNHFSAAQGRITLNGNDAGTYNWAGQSCEQAAEMIRRANGQTAAWTEFTETGLTSTFNTRYGVIVNTCTN